MRRAGVSLLSSSRPGSGRPAGGHLVAVCLRWWPAAGLQPGPPHAHPEGLRGSRVHVAHGRQLHRRSDDQPPRVGESMTVSFRPGRCDLSPGRDLLIELIAHFNAIYPGRAARPGSVTRPEELAPPHGAFILGYENGRPIACGGLRRLEDRVCEIKRMYVVPDARSRGVGRALLEALEAAAGHAGYERVRLDAGPRQLHSRALFASAGYIEIPAYNTNHIASYWGEKTLAAQPPPNRITGQTRPNSRTTRNALSGSAGITVQGGGLRRHLRADIDPQVAAENTPDDCYGR